MYEDFVPERLAKLRTQKGVSARDMSLSLGQANNYINNIENKKSLPAMQSFFYICEYLGVTPQEFFDEGNTYPETLKEFIAEARQLDPQSMQHILGIMKDSIAESKRSTVMPLFVTFFIIFYNVLEMSAPYTDKYSKTVLQTAFFYSPVLPKLPVPRSVPRSVTKSAMTVGVITSCPIRAPLKRDCA